MKKTILYSVLAMLCLLFRLEVTGQTVYPALKIGEPMSDIHLTALLNYPTSDLSMSALKGKVVIFDFWATWCSSCIRNFPRIDSLEDAFPEKVKVIGVAYEPMDKIQHFFASPAGSSFHFTTVTGDKVLSQLFPHRLIPHYVWIDPQGRVAAFTGEDALTPVNVAAFLQEKQAKNFQIKRDLNADRPLFLSEDFPTDNHLLRYALLSKGRYDGLSSGNQFRRAEGKLYGRAVTNSSLLEIYEAVAHALFETVATRYNRKHLILDVPDTTKLTAYQSGRQVRGELYNYEFQVPLAAAAQLYPLMLSDLNSSFGYQAFIDERKVPCLQLYYDHRKDLETKEGKRFISLRQMPHPIMRNSTISTLVQELDTFSFLEGPVVDHTGITDRIDLEFNHPPRDIGDLNEQLRPYGLKLKPGKEKQRVLIIRQHAEVFTNTKSYSP